MSTTFPMRITPLGKVPLLAVGATTSNSHVTVGDQGVTMSMGVYEEHLEVTGAEPMEWPVLYGIGARMTEEVAAYVTSTDNVVKLSLREKRSFRLVPGVTIERDAVCVSVEDPEGLIAAIQALST
ncbi:MAG: hypothetical protein AAFX99_03575 [Myxococcota bacterium]